MIKRRVQKSNFNAYWIYGVIALVLLLINIFGRSNMRPETIHQGELETMIPRRTYRRNYC